MIICWNCDPHSYCNQTCQQFTPFNYSHCALFKIMSTQSLFGVVIPGRAVITEFQPIDNTKAVALLETPYLIPELTFFLLPSTPVPPGYGAILYYSVPPFTDWEILGCVFPEKPSGSFRTGWTTTKFDSISNYPVVQLGVSLEPLETIHNLELTLSGVEDRFEFAHKIALDLFRYMTSFSQTSQPGMMLVPNNVFDSWMERFERKYRQDPNFMMKNSV